MKTQGTEKKKRKQEKPLRLKGRFIDLLDAAIGKEVKPPKKRKGSL